MLDLPQVDLMNFRVEYVRRPLFRSRSGHASDEVARGRLVSLEGFSFAFRAKNEECVTGNWSDDIWKNNRMCVRFSYVERAN